MSESVFGAGFGLFFLLLMAISVGGLVFWIIVLVECIKFPDAVYRAAGSEKITWVLVVALAGWIGGLIYWFRVRSNLLEAERSGAWQAYAAPHPGPFAAQPATPPGWYRDPQADGQLRWWDGWRWTDHTAPG